MRKKCKLYYFANQVYQYSFALPIYRKIQGVFIAKSIKRIFQCNKYLSDRGYKRRRLDGPSPLIKFCPTSKVSSLDGIVISSSNAAIHAASRKAVTIFLGHGTGDKPYGPHKEFLEQYDYHFISGSKHIEKLRDLHLNIPEDKFIKVGNPRFDDYINNRYDIDRELDRLGIIDRTRKNVLYAPTWKWGDGTLLKYAYKFINEITQKYNLIIRPHHHDRKYIPPIRKWARTNGKKHVYFSNPIDLLMSDTMNDVFVSDILISDTSSILYEYLITKKPIIIAKNDYQDLHRMPDKMNIMNHTYLFDGSQNILDVIEKGLEDNEYQSGYQELLHNCFYFNDGKSVERIEQFLESIISQ